MTDYIVTVREDELDAPNGTTLAEIGGANDLSLREAIALANANEGRDTITFAPTFSTTQTGSGTIVLGGTALTITDDLTIQGRFEDAMGLYEVVIDANGASGIFSVRDTTVVLADLLVTGGQGLVEDTGSLVDQVASASAILNAGDLTTTNVFIAGNNGVGLVNLDGSKVGLIDTSVYRNDTGIVNFGMLRLERSEIVANGALADDVLSGGLINFGEAQLANTTLVGNNGAIRTDGDLDLLNVTITDNDADEFGGVLVGGGSITINNSLIVGNVLTEEVAYVDPLPEDAPGNAPFDVNLSVREDETTDVTIASSIIGDETINPASIFAQTVQQTGGGAIGPNGNTDTIVWTAALNPDASNPALDAGDDELAPATDARGRSRVDQEAVDDDPGRSDLGAFELEEQVAPLVVAEPTDDGDDEPSEPVGDEVGDDTGSDDDRPDDMEVVIPDAIVGTPGPDTLRGTENDDTILGLGGNDSLNGAGGNDTLDGGDGDDFLRGGEGINIVLGGMGDDTILTDGIPFVVTNPFGAVVAAGSDTIDGGAGIDTVIIAAGGTREIDLRFTTNFDDSFTSIEVFHLNDQDNLFLGDDTATDVHGGAGDDVIEAGEGDDRLFGRDGEDELRGEDGDDFLSGGAGNDTIEGGAGNDTGGGGAGDDVIADVEGDNTYNGGAGNDFLLGGAGVDRLSGGAGDDVIDGGTNPGSREDGFDRLLGGDGDDTILARGLAFADGGAGDDIITGERGTFAGGDGNDTISGAGSLFGGAGNDLVIATGQSSVIEGGDGDDILLGSMFGERIDGGAGDDVITGGEGDDLLFGGEGADIFVFDVGFGRDQILDGAAFGAGDRIDLSLLMLEDAIDDLLIQGRLVQIDRDGDGVADTGDAIQLNGFTGTLDDDDFVFTAEPLLA